MGLGLENQGSSPNKGDILGVELLDICSQEYLCVCVSLSLKMADISPNYGNFKTDNDDVHQWMEWSTLFSENIKKLICCYGGSSPNSGGKAWSLKMFERSFFDLSQ